MNDPNREIPEKLLHSKKYAKICPDTVLRVWNEQIIKYRKPKDAEHATREALHGITGAFMSAGDSQHSLESLRLLIETGERAHLERALSFHASTRERLPLSVMDEIFDALLADIPSMPNVLDLACGIDPIYLASRGIRVTGCDISGEAVDLVNEVGRRYSMPCRAFCRDLLCPDCIPEDEYDIVLLFKVLPLLDRQLKDGAKRILSEITTTRIAVSFPTRTLGGRDVGMESHYRAWMESHIPAGRSVERSFTIGNELFYVLKKEEAV